MQLSKWIMQSLYYNSVKPAFDNKVTVLMSDTDSWVMAVPASDADEAVSKLSHVMDFSNYDESHSLHNSERKNVPGYLKNELPREKVLRVAAIRSKAYSIETDKDVQARCKGVRKCEVDKIPFSAYSKCVKGRKPKEHRVEQYNIQSKGHVNRLLRMEKLSFSSFDDKRYLLCGSHSVPYGSALIRMSQGLKNNCIFCANPDIVV